MKKIIRKIKDWLIGKLGGFTKKNLEIVYKSQVEVQRIIIQAWASAVQEICRRSDNTYYDWCCDYCAKTCDKHNGWCKRFEPVEDIENYE